MLSLVLMISIAMNVLLIVKNKELKSQLAYFKPKPLKKGITNNRFSKKSDKKQLSELEIELDSEISLDDTTLNKVKINSKKNVQASQTAHQKNLLQTALQSLSGWHKSFIPFLLQNIGWFVGVLCFISGSIFFVSYTEGFSKSVTIFYTILSYTLLLSWSGYYLKEKVTHASMSGMVLLAISFLLVPLNFSAAGRLLTMSLDYGVVSGQFMIAVVSVLIVSVILFYISKLISGLFNRQLLSHFTMIFFSLSALQMIVPVINASQNMMVVIILLAFIMMLLLAAFIFYLPIVLKQVFVTKEFLVLFSVGAIIFSAIVSMLHIGFSSPVNIALSYYAPAILLLSAALFYMDEQLNAYIEKGSFLGYLSVVSYALSFVAIFISFDFLLTRTITISLSILLYARLMWLYRSLVPLYLVVVFSSFLYTDTFLLNKEFLLTISSQWLYISLLPLMVLFLVILIFLRKGELQREKSFLITRHLLHFILISSVLSGVVSQLTMQIESLAWINSLILMISLYLILKSEMLRAFEFFNLKRYTLYLYVLTLLPVLLILSNQFIFIETKLILLTIISLFYSFNSYYVLFRFYDSSIENKQLEKSVLINSSLLVSLLLIVLIALGFSLSIKISLLLLVISLNTLFLSVSLYNRALFYIFMLMLSLSALVLKLQFNTSSSGLFLICIVFLFFYLIHLLQKTAKEKSDLEILSANKIHQNAPEKLLWIYPVNDLAINVSGKYEEDKNV